jgi:DNA replication protein DnaC
MLNEQTINKLNAMKLNGMADAYEEQQKQPRINELSFNERFSLLVERQWLWRENRALQGRLNFAQLKEQACVEDLDFRESRGLKRSIIDQLSACDWVRFHQNVIVTGSTGTGKTYLACALAHKACREGYRSLYFYAPKLFREMTLAHADGSIPKLLKKMARTQLLVIDDWGLSKLNDQDYRHFLELLDDRQGSGATLITSQFPLKTWHETIPDPTLADAIVDRLIHNAHRIEMKGESMRKRKSQ